MSTLTVDEIEAALEELRDNSEEYTEFFDLLKNPSGRRNLPAIIKEGIGAFNEAKKDYATVAPVVTDATNALRQGIGTSEFKAASAVTKVLTVVGAAAPLLEVLQSLLANSTLFDGNSLWVTIASLILKALIAMKYSDDRTKLKREAVAK